METVKIQDKNNVRIIAHRGQSSLECENTCAAFVSAARGTCYGIETDVHRTRDGKYVIIHDDRTGRVSGVDISVENSDYIDLMQVELYDNKTKNTRSDLRIPMLSDYLKICAKYEKIAVLELKNTMDRQSVFEILGEIDTYYNREKMVVISFELSNLVTLRELDESIRLQYLTGEFNEKILDTLKKYRLGLDMIHTSVTKEAVEICHASGIEVNCWTPDTLSEAQKLINAGVDYITSNALE